VPLFYYLVHLALIDASLRHARCCAKGAARPRCSPRDIAAEFGFELGVVYLLWIGVVGSLYPLCRWYAGVKARSRSRWLSYL
jgi:hypothetical protein